MLRKLRQRVHQSTLKSRRAEQSPRCADGAGVQRMIVREGGVLLVIGLVLGVVGAFFAAGIMRGLLFGVTPHDPSTFIIPALRAARIDPALTMRSA